MHRSVSSAVIYAALGDSLCPDHGHLDGAVIVGVAVQMPPAPSERDLYEELLVSMGCVLLAHQGVTTLRQRTRVTARQLEVRMLVIDEIQFHFGWHVPRTADRSERDPVFGQRPAHFSGLRRDSPS